MLLLVFLISICTVCIIGVLYVKRCLSYWKRMGVPTLKPHFLLGNAKSLLACNENIGFYISKITEQFKRQNARFCGFYFSIKPIFIPIEMDLIKKILITDFEHFTDRPFANHKADPLSSHLFGLQGTAWKVLRAKLSPAFGKSKSKMMFPTVKKCVDTLVEIMGERVNDDGIEIKDLSSRFTMDVLASCAFGLDINTMRQEYSDFTYYAREFFSPSLKDTIIRIFMVLSPELLATFKVKSIRSDITNFFLKTVEETVKYRETNNIIRNDFMHLLLQIKNNVDIVDEATGGITKTTNENDALTITEIAAQCFIFYMAGYESSSSAVSFCLYELSLQQLYQDKAREEVTEAVNNNNGELSYEVLSKLPYLDKCLKETMRKYPLLPFLFRTCTKRYKVPDSDVVLEKGTICLLSTLSLQYDPETYPNPEEYDPERFSERKVAKRNSLSWIPFGAGPRTCIASRFGFMQVKFSLAALLLHYSFTLNPKTNVPIVLNKRTIQTLAQDGIWLDVKKI